jgi:hypothetical protein
MEDTPPSVIKLPNSASSPIRPPKKENDSEQMRKASSAHDKISVGSIFFLNRVLKQEE